MKKIVIVGAGAGGLIAGNTIRRNMSREIKKNEVKITILDRSSTHEFQPGYIGIAFRGEDHAKSSRPVSSLILSGIELIPENCSKIDPDNHSITTDAQRNLDYDYLVVSTGCQPDYEQVPGLSKDNLDYHTNAEKSVQIYEKISSIKSGTIVAGIAGLPYKCPPSPNEAALLLDEFFTKRGIRQDIKIKFITPYLRPYPAEPINEVIEPVFKKRNIETVPGFITDSVDPAKKAVVSMEGDEIQYDMLMMVPPHKPSDFLKGEPFTDDDGWIKTDKRDMHISSYSNAFAIGDVTNIPISKAGVEAHLEAIVVSENIINEMKGITEKALFTGRTQCSMETGYKKATFIIGTYDKPVLKLHPSRSKYMMKRMMESMYWGALTGRTEFIFKAYFGPDYLDHVKNASPLSAAAV